MQKVGIAPKPKKQRQQIRNFLTKAGRGGRKTMMRTMLDLMDSRDRAMMQEYRRRMITRARERGINLREIERGE